MVIPQMKTIVFDAALSLVKDHMKIVLFKIIMIAANRGNNVIIMLCYAFNRTLNFQTLACSGIEERKNKSTGQHQGTSRKDGRET